MIRNDLLGVVQQGFFSFGWFYFMASGRGSCILREGRTYMLHWIFVPSPFPLCCGLWAALLCPLLPIPVNCKLIIFCFLPSLNYKQLFPSAPSPTQLPTITMEMSLAEGRLWLWKPTWYLLFPANFSLTVRECAAALRLSMRRSWGQSVLLLHQILRSWKRI